MHKQFNIGGAVHAVGANATGPRNAEAVGAPTRLRLWTLGNARHARRFMFGARAE